MEWNVIAQDTSVNEIKMVSNAEDNHNKIKVFDLLTMVKEQDYSSQKEVEKAIDELNKLCSEMNISIVSLKSPSL